jgi:hypothetical protein
VNAKNASGRCSGFVVVTVTEVLWLESIREVESVTSCARRSYDDMLREEKVIGASYGGSSERAGVNHPPAVCSE